MNNSWFTQTEVFLLHEVVTRLDRMARARVLDPRGFTYAEFLVAMAVNEMTQPPHGEVGELLDMSKSLVRPRVASLLAKGFLIQLRDNDNRRQVRLELTTMGRQALEGAYDQLAGNAEMLLDVLGPSRPQFLQALRRLRDAIALSETSLGEGKPPTLR